MNIGNVELTEKQITAGKINIPAIKGDTGPGIKNLNILENGDLIVHLDNGTESNAGNINKIESANLVDGQLIISTTGGEKHNAGNVYDDEFILERINKFNLNADTKTAEFNENCTIKTNEYNDLVEVSKNEIEEFKTTTIADVNKQKENTIEEVSNLSESINSSGNNFLLEIQSKSEDALNNISILTNNSLIEVKDEKNNSITQIKEVSQAEKDDISKMTESINTRLSNLEEKEHTHANKTLLDSITENDISKYNTGYEHSQSLHAPTNAQANVIEGIKVNGIEQPIEGKVVNITIGTEEFAQMINQVILESDKKKYPIGKVEINTTGDNPANYLGFGTWVAWGSGRVPVGVDENDTDFNTSEKTGGSKTITLTTANLPSHSHTYTKAIGTASIKLKATQCALISHTHTYNKANSTSGSTTLTANQIPSHTHTFTGTAQSHGHSFTKGGHVVAYGTSENQSSNFGTGYGVATNQGSGWYASSNKYQSTIVNASVTPKGTNSNTGGGQGHTHNVSTTSTNTGSASTSEATEAHNHNITSESIDTGNAGSGTEVSIQQKYITCYMWKRTA